MLGVTGIPTAVLFVMYGPPGMAGGTPDGAAVLRGLSKLRKSTGGVRGGAEVAAVGLVAVA